MHAAVVLLAASSCARVGAPPESSSPACFACEELDATRAPRQDGTSTVEGAPARSLEGSPRLGFETVRLGQGAVEETPARPARRRRIDLDLVRAPFADTVRLLGDVGGFNVVVEETSGAPVTVRLVGVDAYDALLAICEARSLPVRTRRGIVVVGGDARGAEGR